MLKLLKNKKVLFVVAHPDDEILGPGATIYQLVKHQNCIVKVIILGEGITSRSEKRDTSKWKKELKIHKSNIEKAKSILGYQYIKIYDFPDNRFDTVPLLDIVKIIENENDFRPDFLFTHHGGDLNIDHQKTFEAALTSSRPLPNENLCSLITFETMSSTEFSNFSDTKSFKPNLIIEISDDALNAKCNAMASYQYEKRNFPHPRSNESIRNRAKMWGISNGIKAAEVFQIIRLIDKK